MNITTRRPAFDIDPATLAEARDGMPFALFAEESDGRVHGLAFFGCLDDALAHAMRMSIDMDGSTYHVYSMNRRAVILTVWPIGPRKEG